MWRATAIGRALRNGRSHRRCWRLRCRKYLRPLLSFELGPGAVEEIAAKLVAWLTLDAAERERARVALANEAARLYSWESVAKGVIAAAQGRLAGLPRPATPAVGLRAP